MHMNDVGCILLEYEDLLSGRPKPTDSLTLTQVLAPFAVWLFTLFFESFSEVAHYLTLNQATVASSCFTNCTTLVVGHTVLYTLLSGVPKQLADGLSEIFPLNGDYEGNNVTVHISCCEAMCTEGT